MKLDPITRFRSSSSLPFGYQTNPFDVINIPELRPGFPETEDSTQEGITKEDAETIKNLERDSLHSFKPPEQDKHTDDNPDLFWFLRYLHNIIGYKHHGK